MSNIVENVSTKVSNTASSYIGGAKQTIGETINNPDLAARGAAQKVQADTAQRVADAKIQAEATAHKAEGQTQKATGNVLGDYSLEASGEGNITKGEIEHRV
ncbi:hypothetical protein BGZ88_000777 [Linnemannia elongata]|uniref:CsbD-like domain-containing protein n=1 Tax=Linnemannia elongata AG-77 TaxID=1314771 RepID=A0A197JVB3_9FUNG|nr:hypothetical protein BGZ88_000777 [Linnemannia elongata]KAK5822439.1 hypothetical protein F5H01DRAFT_410719 [Linnemannia elongata]OAQ29150.1 hypothetical protein K457DRAFT_138186 [Linnemannia elongata AG-77]